MTTIFSINNIGISISILEYNIIGILTLLDIKVGKLE